MNVRKLNMLNYKKLLITKELLPIKNIIPITKNFENFNKNIYNNMKSILDCDEKKKNIISYIDNRRKKEREQRSTSPLLNINSSSVNYKNNNIYFNQIKTSNKIIKDYQTISHEYSNEENFNKIRYSSQNYKNINIHHNKQYSNNNLSKLFYSKDDEDDEVNKKINEMRRNIKNQIEKENPIKAIKNDNLQITFLRINISTVKHKNEENEFKKEQFDICFNGLNKINNEKDNKKDNIFKKESYNFYIKGNDNKDKNFIKECDNFYVKGNKKDLIFEKEFNHFSIKENNKKKIILEKEFIDFKIQGINEKNVEKEKDLPLKLSNDIKCMNEIDQVENFEFIHFNNINKKENKQLINIGINTMKDKRKFENKGISVNFFPITTQIGINTDDIENRLNNINKINTNENKYNYKNENINKKNNNNIYNIKLQSNKKEKREKRTTTSKERLQIALKEYINKRIELETDDYIVESSSNNSYQGNYSQLENS